MLFGRASLLHTTLFLLTVVHGVASAATADRLGEDQSLEVGEGAVLFYMPLPPPSKKFWKVREFSLRVERVEDGAVYNLVNVNHPQLYVLPAGRYLPIRAKTVEGDTVANIAPKDGWFEVIAGTINYVGSWRLGSLWGLDGDSVTFTREPIDALQADYATQFKRLGLSLSAPGKSAVQLRAAQSAITEPAPAPAPATTR
jgi:hypothetical protein